LGEVVDGAEHYANLAVELIELWVTKNAKLEGEVFADEDPAKNAKSARLGAE
jgi:hypothetical protein